MRRYCQRGTSCRVEGNDSCDDGLFCCKDNLPTWYKRVIGVCRKSCNGYPCAGDSDCGPPDECCLGERCEICGLTCSSSSDCHSNAVCCKGSAFGESTCTSSCDREACITSNDCRRMHLAWCVNGTRSLKK